MGAPPSMALVAHVGEPRAPPDDTHGDADAKACASAALGATLVPCELVAPAPPLPSPPPAKKKTRLTEPGKAPQPRGRPPKGKLWDADAGQWYDDPLYVPEPKAPKAPKAVGGSGSSGAAGFAAVPAAAGAGSTCADGAGAGDAWPPPPATKARAGESGQLPQPRGRPPKGKVWDPVLGSWVDDPAYVPQSKAPKHAGGKRVHADGSADGDADGTGRPLDAAACLGGIELVTSSLVTEVESAPGVVLASIHRPSPPPPPPKLAKHKLENGQIAQPRGRPPAGKVWDRDVGAWADDPAYAPQPKAKKPRGGGGGSGGMGADADTDARTQLVAISAAAELPAHVEPAGVPRELAEPGMGLLTAAADGVIFAQPSCSALMPVGVVAPLPAEFGEREVARELKADEGGAHLPCASRP
ncbi:hypothetical protein KFE25_010301 [Diacronema lutheri]|uniref:Uncharacterized protein n=2 Tax=Diacronema lutheri TaxID=2081491 RepID=A0A8J5X6Z2_DIALT|nr:hypothetical protein KFE25_010301 [Diacronema lutheri]